jgi:hypothetical protein
MFKPASPTLSLAPIKNWLVIEPKSMIFNSHIVDTRCLLTCEQLIVEAIREDRVDVLKPSVTGHRAAAQSGS